MFTPFPKIPRLKRGCSISEKIDGTNASIYIGLIDEVETDKVIAAKDGFAMLAGSRSRWVIPGDDNYGFAAWVLAHVDALWTLGPGQHFGEWWGQGVQRNYGLKEKRFSLFNTDRWVKPESGLPACCGVVPVLYRGPFTDQAVQETLALLAQGSAAAPDFMKPEGIVVFHYASRSMFKVTLENDSEPKGANGKE